MANRLKIKLELEWVFENPVSDHWPFLYLTDQSIQLARPIPFISFSTTLNQVFLAIPLDLATYTSIYYTILYMHFLTQSIIFSLHTTKPTFPINCLYVHPIHSALGSFSLEEAPHIHLTIILLIYRHTCWLTLVRRSPWPPKRGGPFVEVPPSDLFSSCNKILNRILKIFECTWRNTFFQIEYWLSSILLYIF